MKFFIYFLSALFLVSLTSQSNKEPTEVYIRVFKYEKVLEIWSKTEDTFHLERRYPICMLSGIVGPKRKEGDLQVPEGFYYINDFNPYSKYKKSLGVSYPNRSDSLLSPYKKLGGSIYIHGDCVSVGCIAVGNKFIEDIYQLCRRMNGKIQIHIFPIDFSCPESKNYLEKKLENRPELIKFEKNLEEGFFYFENSKKLPQILVNECGYYEFN